MSFSRVNTWTAGTKLTATQINQLDTNITNSFDIRSGQNNSIASSNTFTNYNTFNSNTFLLGYTFFGTNVLYNTNQSRKLFIPAKQLILFNSYTGVDASTYSSESYLSYHKIKYNTTHNNTNVRFNLDLNQIPQGAILNSLILHWQPVNYAANPLSASQVFTMRFSRSKSFETYTFSNDPAANPNAMSDYNTSALCTGGYTWLTQTSRSTTLTLSSLTHLKAGEQCSLAIELANNTDLNSTAAINVFGLQINYEESNLGMP